MFSSASKSEETTSNNDKLPSDDGDIVRFLIKKQKFNGLWDFDQDIIEKLVGKPFSAFQSVNADIKTQVLLSTIVVLVLETRFATFSSLWYGVVQKARKQICCLLSDENKDFDMLVDNVRKQL